MPRGYSWPCGRAGTWSTPRPPTGRVKYDLAVPAELREAGPLVFHDALAEVREQWRAAKGQRDLKPVVDVADRFALVRADEHALTGGTAESDTLGKEIERGAATMVTQKLATLAKQVQNARRTANYLVYRDVMRRNGTIRREKVKRGLDQRGDGRPARGGRVLRGVGRADRPDEPRVRRAAAVGDRGPVRRGGPSGGDRPGERGAEHPLTAGRHPDPILRLKGNRCGRRFSLARACSTPAGPATGRTSAGDRARFLPGLVTIAVAFVAGAATGIVANAPVRARKRAGSRGSVGPAARPAPPPSFDITE